MAVSPGKIHPKAKQDGRLVFCPDYVHPEGAGWLGFVGLCMLIACFEVHSLAREKSDPHTREKDFKTALPDLAPPPAPRYLLLPGRKDASHRNSSARGGRGAAALPAAPPGPLCSGKVLLIPASSGKQNTVFSKNIPGNGWCSHTAPSTSLRLLLRRISASAALLAKPGKSDNERSPSSLSHTFPNACFNARTSGRDACYAPRAVCFGCAETFRATGGSRACVGQGWKGGELF